MKHVLIGKILSAQGIRGDLFVYIFAQEAAWVDQWTELSLGAPGAEGPQRSFNLKKIKPHQKQKKIGFVVSIAEVKDRTQAEELVGQSVFVPESFLVSSDDDDIYLREVLGFRVHDEQRGDVGEVVGFAGTSLQDILVVKNSEEATFDVPFVEPILIEIQKDKKIILMDIPQGLVAGEEL